MVFYIILPVFILESLLFFILADSQIKIVREKVISIQQQIVSNVENELRESKLLLATIAHNDYLIKNVSDYTIEKNQEKKLELIYKIEGNLDNLFNYHNKIDSIAFFYKEEGILFFSTPLADPEKYRQKEWYKDALDREGDVIIIEELTPLSRERSSIPRINLIIAPPRRSSLSNVEVIILSMNSESLSNLPGKAENQNESYAVLNNRDQVLFSNPQLSDSGKNKAVNRYPIKQSPWIFETSFSYRERVFNALKMFTLIFSAIIICIILFFFVFTRRLASSILEPIVNLSNRMGEVGLWQQTAALDNEKSEAYQVEIRQIFDSFDHMSNRLVDLNQETLRLELEALQFQINPHFLINTLNSIKILAQIRGNVEVAKMTKELMGIVDGLLHRTGMLTTIEKELDCVTGYIHIQKIRFGDIFDCSINIPGELKELTILKMILQPIIENAIQHGFRKSDQRGHLTITVTRKKDRLIIQVQDDSRQADLSKIQTILQSALQNSMIENTDEHKGLRNIQRRIFLRYGRPWGVTASVEKDLTIFTVLLPVVESNGENI